MLEISFRKKEYPVNFTKTELGYRKNVMEGMMHNKKHKMETVMMENLKLLERLRDAKSDMGHFMGKNTQSRQKQLAKLASKVQPPHSDEVYEAVTAYHAHKRSSSVN